MRLLKLVVVLALLCLFSPGILAQDQAEKERQLNEYIAKHPSTFDGYVMRATLNFGIGKEDLALADIRKANEVSPNNAPGLVLLGLMAMKKGHYQEAIDYADKALAVHPHLIDALQMKAGAHDKMGRTDLRVGDQLEFQEAHRRLGDAYLKDHGFSDPIWFEDSVPATSNTAPPAQHPWLPPASEQSATPGNFSSFSSIFGKPSTLTTPATDVGRGMLGPGVAKPSSLGGVLGPGK